MQYIMPGNETPTPPRDVARLQPPQLPSGATTGEPERQASPALPAGIPQFARVKENIASGLKPILDGVDWLRQNGYRTVLHIRQPGDDDSTDRRLFEERGLKFISLEVSPDLLNPRLVEEFNKTVTDAANLPLFVYDKDGLTAGALWYLHFRTVEKANDAEARTRAAELGLKDTQSDAARAVWLAIQKYLEQNPK
jgi:hypothetical protein